MRSSCVRLATAAFAAACIATAIGPLAVWLPVAGAPEHFAPVVLLIAVAGLALLLCGARAHAGFRYRHIALGLGLAGVAVLNAMPLATSLAQSAVASPGSGATLKVVSFNVFTGNPQLHEAARWLAQQDADVIVLQEMTRKSREPMRQALAALYPHVYDCNCHDIVIYSRRPWIAAGSQPRSAEQPPLAWVTLADGRGGEVRIVGLRARFPMEPRKHAAHYSWLTSNVQKLGRERLILVGDFNAAPWSQQMLRLAAAGGLRRHGTYAVSWPSLLPFVLIDNVLTTPDIKGVSFRTGPFLGSDHLPIVATVAL